MKPICAEFTPDVGLRLAILAYDDGITGDPRHYLGGRLWSHALGVIDRHYAFGYRRDYSNERGPR